MPGLKIELTDSLYGMYLYTYIVFPHSVHLGKDWLVILCRELNQKMLSNQKVEKVGRMSEKVYILNGETSRLLLQG